jgi:hypothetical protein
MPAFPRQAFSFFSGKFLRGFSGQDSAPAKVALPGLFRFF